MKTKETISNLPFKKEWIKPTLSDLDIKKDTFAGTGVKIEKNSGQGPTSKKS